MAIWALDFSGMSTSIKVTNNYNHKVFNSIILFIFNRTKGIFNSLMMHKFPSVEATTKMLSHYKTMFWNITSLVCHRVKESIFRHPNHNISIRFNLPTSLPSRVLGARWFSTTTSTFLTAQARWNSLFQRCPSLFATTNTSSPYILIKSTTTFINPIRVYLFGSSYLTYLWHTCIIPYAQKVRKGVS